MTRLRTATLLTAALVAAVLLFLLLTLPPQPAATTWAGDADLPARTVAGAYHVHTTRSDGSADKDVVAAAAARAGLRFVLFTEHGDGTAPPDPPQYLSGVLCLDGVEISTNGGHYTALDLPQTPFPLGGEADAVIEDVRRFGGFGFAAHPDSQRPALAWTDWTLPFDGVEWLNADSEWRNEPRARMLRVLFDYLLRPGPALASLLDRPVMTLTRWDALTTRRPVLALAGHDAHGGFGVGTEGGEWWGIPVPSYEASFRTFTTVARLEHPLSGDAAADARALLAAIRAGRVHTVIDALATPGYLDLRQEGSALIADASMPEGAELVVLHADGPVVGREIARTTAGRQIIEGSPLRGAYRVEVRVRTAPGEPPVPWLVSNPVFFLPGTEPPPAVPELGPKEAAGEWTWHVEHDPSSAMRLETRADDAVVRFELGGDPPRSQFAAAAAELRGALPAFDGLHFEGQASRPMRVSVQLRYAEGDLRWGRSVFLDENARQVTVATDGLAPLDGQATRAPAASGVRSVLFVVDLVNARPGDQGQFEIRELRLLHATVQASEREAR